MDITFAFFVKAGKSLMLRGRRLYREDETVCLRLDQIVRYVGLIEPADEDAALALRVVIASLCSDAPSPEPAAPPAAQSEIDAGAGLAIAQHHVARTLDEASSESPPAVPATVESSQP